jgi:hypothetical protein
MKKKKSKHPNCSKPFIDIHGDWRLLSYHSSEPLGSLYKDDAFYESGWKDQNPAEGLYPSEGWYVSVLKDGTAITWSTAS